MIILFSFLLFGFIFLYLFHLKLYDDYEETFTHHYELVQDQLVGIEKFQWTEEEVALSLKPSLSQKEFSIFLFSEAGELVYGPTHSPSDVSLVSLEFLEKALHQEIFTEGGWIDGVLSYHIGSPIQFPGSDQGGHTTHNEGVMVMMFHDLDHQYQQVVYHILTTFLITIAFAGVILWFISRKITSPLQEMNHTVLRYAKGDFSQTVKVKTNDELGQLGSSVNYMAEELSTLEETRNKLIADVSHDLRSPLTSIKGFLVALIDGTVPSHRREKVYLLMKEETERVIKLVNDTLDMSQLEAGQVKIKPEKYNLTKQLQMTVAKLEPQLESKDVTIRIVPDDEPIHVFADRDRMEQALINLLQNGIQFSPRTSEIKIMLDKNKEHHFVEVRVQDQGPGINEDMIAHIWKRFYKTDEARTNKAGAGIGLSIVKSIMDLHHVDVHVESKEGEGTTFYFRLPLSRT